MPAIQTERFQDLIDIYGDNHSRVKTLNNQSRAINEMFLEAYNDDDKEKMLEWWQTLRHYIDLTLPTIEELEIYMRERNHFEHSGRRNKKNRLNMRIRRASNLD